MPADFAIVGGGIGGAVLAQLLARGGKRVVVLERSLGPAGPIRPEILWPATIETLFSLAPREEWEKTAILPLRDLDLRNRKGLQPFFTPEILAQAAVQPWSTDPARTRERLLALAGPELRRGVEVPGALRHGDRVVGVRAREAATGREIEIEAGWTVGDDGARSVVREARGIPIETRMFPFDFLCFRFDWPASLPPGRGRLFANRGPTASRILGLLAIPLPQARGAGVVFARPSVFEDSEAGGRWARFAALYPEIRDVAGERRFPEDFARVQRPWGHAPRYGLPGALLMGDALHPVSPAGGQGANMSVADARALAAAALDRPERLLEEYEGRRRAANERSIGITRLAARILGLPSWCRPASVFFFFLGFLRRHPELLARGLRAISTSFLDERPQGGPAARLSAFA